MSHPKIEFALRDLIDQVPKGLGIEIAMDNRRVVAEIFGTPNGIVFADIGWADPTRSSHPFHEVKGKLAREKNGFRIGNVSLLEITEDDPLCWEWLGWVQYRNSHEGGGATREACRRAIQSEGVSIIADPDFGRGTPA